MRGLSPVAASGGHSSSWCAGLSLSRPLLLWSTGSRRAGSVVVAHGPSRSVACGIFPDQGSNPCPLHWQADSQPLRHQGSPWCMFLCQYHTVMITITLLYNLKPGNVISSILFFFLKITLASRFWCVCGSIWILGIFFLFLWKMSLGFWQGLYLMCISL